MIIYVNNNTRFKGLTVPLAKKRYRSLEDLKKDLEYRLKQHVHLPTGVQKIYDMDGFIVKSLNDLTNSTSYIVGGLEKFQLQQYTTEPSVPSKVRKNLQKVQNIQHVHESPRNDENKLPTVGLRKTEKMITVYHINTDLRIALKVLINRKSLSQLTQVFESLTKGFRNNDAAINRITHLYSITGHKIQNIEDLWGPNDIFIAASRDNIKWKDLHIVIQTILKTGKSSNKEDMKKTIKEELYDKKMTVIDAELDEFNNRVRIHKQNLNQPIKSIMKKPPGKDSNELFSDWTIKRPDISNQPITVHDLTESMTSSQNNASLYSPSNTPQKPTFYSQTQPITSLPQKPMSMPHLTREYHQAPVWQTFQPEPESHSTNYCELMPYTEPIQDDSALIQYVPPVRSVEFIEKYPEIEENYKMIGLMGFGKHCRVYRGKQKRSQLQPIALKVIRPDRLLSKTCKDMSPLKEINFIQDLNHKNVVQIIDWIESASRITTVFELAEKGDLFQLIKQRGAFSEEHTFWVVREIASALHYLHYEKNIIHRNVKLENILVFGISRHRMSCKLCDFGLAVHQGDEEVTQVIGTIHYLSPEMLEEKSYSYPADVWALGIVTYILLSLIPPFFSFSDDKDEIKDKIIRHDYYFPIFLWNSIKPESIYTIDQMLIRNPSERITALDLLCHPWVLIQTDLISSAPKHHTAMNWHHSHHQNYGFKTEQDLINKCESRKREILGEMSLEEEQRLEEARKKETDVKSKSFFDKLKQFFEQGVYDTKFKPFLQSGTFDLKERRIKLPQTDHRRLDDSLEF